MTTRRDVLRLAAAAAGVSALGSCGDAPDPAPEPPELLFLTTGAGTWVLDAAGRVVTPATPVATATPDWRHTVTVHHDGAGSRIVVQDLATRRVRWVSTAPDRIEPRTISPDGALVASVPPGGAGVYGLHQPGGRGRTTVVVSADGTERARATVDGNVEPEAFAPDSDVLFVLDYLPADRPRRFRVRAIDLTSLHIADVPTWNGQAPEVRAHRVDRVHDPRRATQFALYSHEATATAFVQCLDLRERRVRRIDLPPPFGRERPGVHGIALSGDRLCVVHAPSGTVADIDPDRLVIRRIGAFADTGRAGKPTPVLDAAGALLVGVDDAVIMTAPRREIAAPGEARGLRLGAGAGVWRGYPEGVVRYDLGSGREAGRVVVPGMFTLKHVRFGPEITPVPTPVS
jgi:hypothetical protein